LSILRKKCNIHKQCKWNWSRRLLSLRLHVQVSNPYNKDARLHGRPWFFYGILIDFGHGLSNKRSLSDSESYIVS
jgi:hypothetical protein